MKVAELDGHALEQAKELLAAQQRAGACEGRLKDAQQQGLAGGRESGPADCRTMLLCRA